jgi:predicted metalloendopeptidase
MYIEQDGLGLPDPKYYTENAQAVAGYKEVIASMLTLSGTVTGDGAREAEVCDPYRQRCGVVAFGGFRVLQR